MRKNYVLSNQLDKPQNWHLVLSSDKLTLAERIITIQAYKLLELVGYIVVNDAKIFKG